MIIFFAGDSDERLERVRQQFFNEDIQSLVSFLELEIKRAVRYFKKKMMEGKKVQLFIDSGAFSAWSRGVKINIDDYIRFIKENIDIIDFYANLDVIGDVESTWKNQKIIEEAGLHPLPVYHMKDPIEYLYKCLDNYEYFCLGGMARGYTTFDRYHFLDRCFEIICDTPNRYPKCKVHGFGISSLRMLLRYPWYSVDSTTWIMQSQVGSIIIPRWKDRWIYDEQSWIVYVSNRGTARAQKNISTMSSLEKSIFFKYLDEKGYKLGESKFIEVDQSHKLNDNERWVEKVPKDKTKKRKLEVIIEPGISNKYELRSEVNILYFLDLEKSIPEWPWPFREKNKTTNALF